MIKTIESNNIRDMFKRHHRLIFSILSIILIIITLRWVEWQDAIIDQNGRYGYVISESQNYIQVNFSDAKKTNSTLIEYVPNSKISKRIIGIQSILKRFKPKFLLLVITVEILIYLLLALRWANLINILSLYKVKLRNTLAWYLQARVADVIGFGQLGMEAYRLTVMGKAIHNFTLSGIVQLTERIVGLIALLFIIIIGSLMLTYQSNIEMNATRDSIIMLFSIIILILLCVFFLFKKLLQSNYVILKQPRIIKYLGNINKCLKIFNEKPKVILVTLGISFCIHLMIVLYYYMLSKCLCMDMSIIPFLIAIPIVTIVLTLPISFAGLGVFEGSMILLLTASSSVTVSEIIMLCALHRILGIPKRLLNILALNIPIQKTCICKDESADPVLYT